MKTKSLIKACEKLGYRVHNHFQAGNVYSVNTNRTSLRWHNQNGEAVAVNTLDHDRINDHRPEMDSRADEFHYTLRSVVEKLSEE